MKAAIYARVSTEDQSAAMQIRELLDYCERRGWEIVQFPPDEGFSGSRQSRPGLDALMAACRRRQVDVVVVYRFDRFARSVRQLVLALDEFNALGIQFVSLHESVDTSTPSGKLTFHLFAAIAEFERELIRERVKSGMAHARAHGTRSGKTIGRQRVPVDLQKLTALRRNGASIRAIARQTGLGAGTVVRALSSAV